MNEPAKRYRTPESSEKPTLAHRWAAPWLPPFQSAAGPISDGECDFLRVKLEDLLAGGVCHLLLNLADLTHVDSAGFSIIAKVCVSLRDQGGDLRFVGPNGGRALMAFKVLRLLDMIPTFDNEKDALASFRPKSSVAQA